MSHDELSLIMLLAGLIGLAGPVSYRLTQKSTWAQAFGFFRAFYVLLIILVAIFLLGCRSHTLDYPDASERVPATAPLGHTIVCAQGDPLCKAEDSADD